MKKILDWLFAIGAVLLLLGALYTIWIVAIFLAILMLIYIVKTVYTLEHIAEDEEEIND